MTTDTPEDKVRYYIFEVSISDLVGKIFSSVETEEGDLIKFTCDNGFEYLLGDFENWIRRVGLEDVIGDLTDLIGRPIIRATEDKNNENIKEGDYDDTCLWTFYNLATEKGHVTIRFYGDDEGFYSSDAHLYVRVKGLGLPDRTEDEAATTAFLKKTHSILNLPYRLN